MSVMNTLDAALTELSAQAEGILESVKAIRDCSAPNLMRLLLRANRNPGLTPSKKSAPCCWRSARRGTKMK